MDDSISHFCRAQKKKSVFSYIIKLINNNKK